MTFEPRWRDWAVWIFDIRACAKAPRQEQAWCVARNRKEVTVATVERARRRVIGNGFREAATHWFRSYGVLQVSPRMKLQ